MASSGSSSVWRRADSLAWCRREARTGVRVRSDPGVLRPNRPPPPRSWRQPPAHCALHRLAVSKGRLDPRPPPTSRAGRRGQDPPRSDPLPQAPPRPPRLAPHAAVLDNAPSPDARARRTRLSHARTAALPGAVATWLTYRPAYDPRAPPTSPPPPSEVVHKRQEGQLRVLLVEDHLRVRHGLAASSRARQGSRLPRRGSTPP